MSIVQCPVCQQTLVASGQHWSCENEHHFDNAKQGYCNLLLANQKKSPQPGDDKKMLQARHRFLNAGFYQPIVDQIHEIATKYCSDASEILDVGCGEGYYLAGLQQQMANESANYYGTDISKEALKLAARQYQSCKWFVAAAKQQPFFEQKIDLILNIFAPADWDEISRLLKPGGYVLLAVAGSNHLRGLRELIYDQVKAHHPERFLDKIGAELELIEQFDCQFELQLDDNDAIRDLLQMTPYYWKASETRRQSIESLQSLTTPVNFRFYLLQA